MKKIAVLAAGAAALVAAGALAQSGGASFQNPCHAAPATDFDFWLGDWVVFDWDTGVLQGVDRVTKANNGCVLMQDWAQMTDRFRAPGADFRYAGVSMSSVLPDGRWQQVWVGNYGGTIVVTGGLDEAGRMVLESEPQTSPQGQVFYRRWHWRKFDDGTLRSWGEIRVRNADGSWGEPTIPWNIRYVRRADAPPLIAAESR
ncbi:MAG: hypothetical protein Tsb0010_11140 [Parvularculaceae bacterium]